ncbi:MAG: GNAT family N-acetyltransferase [Arenimonas sp.]|nr:GNAT family N-acetyltransferase [Arenimonas sp.]
MPAIPTLPPVLESDRIRLRPLRMDDAPDVFAMYSDPDVTRYWSFSAWTQPAQADAWLAERIGWGPPSVYGWAMANRGDDRFIGTTALFALSGPTHRAELGYSLMPSLQGQGLATEAVRRALDFGFDTLGLERVEADVDPRNLASCRLAERLGFQREGLLRNRWRVGGEFADSILYGLLRGEYRRAA